MDVAALAGVAFVIPLLVLGAVGLSVLKQFLTGGFLVIDLTDDPAEDRPRRGH